MTESFDLTGGADIETPNRRGTDSISDEPAEGSEVFCNHVTACPKCRQEEDFYLTESITYRASFSDGMLCVYGNKDNSIDWIRCNVCGYEFTMREIESTRINFN